MDKGAEGGPMIDAYTHFAPPRLIAYLEEKSGKPLVFGKLFSRIPLLTDSAARVASMDAKGVAAQVLVPLPWLETVPEVNSNPEWSLEACRIANEDLTSLARTYPGRFLPVGLLPTGSPDNPEVMMQAYRHAIEDLGMAGVCFFVGPTSTPPDHDGFEQLYALAEKQGVAIWLHPSRPQFFHDYEAYKGKGSLYQIWNTLGWVYDTSVAMVHMVMGGVFKRYPKLKVVTHHHGGMIPFFTERFTVQSQNFDDDEGLALLQDLHLFYCDTATFGPSPLNIRQAVDFFGVERVLFGTDTPMDMANPGSFHDTALVSIDGAGLTAEEERRIRSTNLIDMLTDGRDTSLPTLTIPVAQK